MPPISLDPMQPPSDTPWYEELEADSFGAEIPSEAEVRRAVAGDRPVLPEAPATALTLPRGYSSAGVTHTEVEVRELTGSDEEYLSRFKGEEAVFDGLIALGVVRIGSLDLSEEPVSARRRILGTLLIGERLQIFLKIVEATFGNEKELRYTCASCDETQDVTVLLNEDFKINVPEGLQQVYEFTLRSGKKVTYRLLVGDDLTEISADQKKSVAQANTALLSRIILEVDGLPPGDPEELVRSFSIGDRDRLLQAVADNQPDVALSLDMTCLSCHEEVKVPVSWGQLFRA